MPFQISLHSSTKSRGVINSLTAGTDQYATCAAEITLTATVDGNLGGHTVGWEQVAGDTQIVWLTPTDQLSVTFAIVGEGSNDRTFRFYIDKGTPLELSDDVVTWGTPTETDPIPAITYSHPTDFDTPCRNISCSSITLKPAPLTLPNLPTLYGSTISVKPTVSYMFNWTAPTCDTQYLQYTTIVRNNGGILEQLGIISPGTTTSLVTSKTDAYYFYVTYKIQGIESTQFSCRFYQPTAAYPDSVFVDEVNVPASTYNTTTTTYYTLASYPVPDDMTSTSTVTVNSLTTVYYTLLAAPTTESQTGGPSSTINTVTLTYYSNNGIGG